MKEENWIDRMVRKTWERVNNSKLKPIMDNLGLKRNSGDFTISGDLGYISIKLNNPRMEIRAHDNGKVFVYSEYSDHVGAWGGYTRKYEVTDLSIFKTPKWKQIVRTNGVKTTPDIIMK